MNWIMVLLGTLLTVGFVAVAIRYDALGTILEGIVQILGGIFELPAGISG